MKKALFLLTILLFSACNQAPIAPTPQSTMPGPQETATVAIKPPATQLLLETPTLIPTLPSATFRPTSTPIPGLPAGQPVNLTSIHLIDATTGWAFEKNNRILRTVDGGNTWQDVTPPQGVYNEGGFFALDADTAWATPYQKDCYGDGCTSYSDFATIWRTEDGGVTWQGSPPLCLNPSENCHYDYAVVAEYYSTKQMQFLDKNTGWLLVSVMQNMMQDRYRIYHTTDGGISWKLAIDSLGGPYAAIATGLGFLDEENGWFGVSQVGGAQDPLPNWYIYKTTDGGHTWNQASLPEPASLPEAFAQNIYWCGAANVNALPPQTVDLTFYCNLYNANSGSRYDFHFHSSNGGQTWRSWLSTGNENFVNANVGWRLYASGKGQAGQLQQTIDGGQTWKTIKTVAWQSAQFDFVSEQVGWAIVTNGDVTALVHTSDGGQTWEEIKPTLVVALSLLRDPAS